MAYMRSTMYPVIRYRFNNIERRGTGSRHAAGRRGVSGCVSPADRLSLGLAGTPAARLGRLCSRALLARTHSRSRDCPPVSRLGPAYV